MNPEVVFRAIYHALRELRDQPPTTRERFAKIAAQYGKHEGVTAEQVLAALDRPVSSFLPVTP